MARLLTFGNGHFHVGLDVHGLVSDVYYPYVGLETHVPPGGLNHKIGIHVDGRLTWLDDPGWDVRAHYHAKTMVGETVLRNIELGLRVELTDAVDCKKDVFVRSIHVINERDQPRRVTLYAHQVFMISDAASSDSAQYRPDMPSIMHYKGRRVFMASLFQDEHFFDDYSIGHYDAATGAGTYRDAEDGTLEKNTVENGQVDSIFGLVIDIGAYDSVRASYVLVAAQQVSDAETVFQSVLSQGLTHYLTRTATYWRDWLGRSWPINLLPPHDTQMFETSLITIAAHIDERGAVMASLDSSLRNHPQDDAYNFCWPRDSFYILWPLVRLGYHDELLRFADFASKSIHEDGFLYHKYRADGSLGSTWLPYVHPDGSVHPPIQTDETAGVLFLLGQYYRQTNDQAFVVNYYAPLVEPMANFLAGYVDGEGLPRPSYGPWEHHFLTHTYTTALTYAALVEAAELADAYGRTVDAERWRRAASAMQRASRCFYNSDEAYFYKGFSRAENGEKMFDTTLDVSSLYGVFMFGLFDIDDESVSGGLETVRRRLGKDGLFSRFEGDDYFSTPDSPNLWPVASLWMAQIALERDEVELARQSIDAVRQLALISGVLPEQVRRDQTPVSLAPLVWSHAELVSTLIDLTQVKKAAV